jgi:hypothetical protein
MIWLIDKGGAVMVKKNGFAPIIIVLILVVVAAAIGGFVVLSNRVDDKKEVTVKDEPQASTSSEEKKDTSDATVADAYGTCPSSPGATTFYNKIIGLEFCYPSSWGEATVGSVEASSSDNGQAYEISFSTKAGLTVAAATSDWRNTTARDGRCADPDPTQSAPQFSTYREDWLVEGAGAGIASALRVHIKKEPRYLIRELASDYYGAVCLTGIVATPGGAYPVQFVNLLRAFSSTGDNAVTDHTVNPNALITPAERVEFGEMVDSMHHAN